MNRKPLALHAATAIAAILSSHAGSCAGRRAGHADRHVLGRRLHEAPGEGLLRAVREGHRHQGAAGRMGRRAGQDQGHGRDQAGHLGRGRGRAQPRAAGLRRGLAREDRLRASSAARTSSSTARPTTAASATIVFGTIYAYNADKFPNGGPQTWADFWDVKKFPGQRALRKAPKTTLEFALMADGVPAEDVYKVLGTKDGVDRAFKKLDQLQAERQGLVERRRAAAAAPGRRRGGDDDRLERPHRRRGQEQRQELQDRLGRQGLDFNLLGDPEGHEEQGAGAAVHRLRRQARGHGRAVAIHLLRPDAEGRDRARCRPSVLADLPTAPANIKNAFVVRRVLGRPRARS